MVISIAVVEITIAVMEGYRSGHNGAVLKTVRAVMSTGVRIPYPPP